MRSVFHGRLTTLLGVISIASSAIFAVLPSRAATAAEMLSRVGGSECAGNGGNCVDKLTPTSQPCPYLSFQQCTGKYVKQNADGPADKATGVQPADDVGHCGGTHPDCATYTNVKSVACP